jgi:hypothetical protein
MRAALAVFCGLLSAGDSAAKKAAPNKTPPPSPKATSEVLAISGSASTYRFRKTDEKKLCGGVRYVSEQRLTIKNLGKSARVMVWTRGMPDLSFVNTGDSQCCERDHSHEFKELQLPAGGAVNINYRICAPVISSLKEQGSILISADGLPPETIPVAIETEEGWDSRLWTGFLGAGVGGCVSFLFFLFQQIYHQSRERERSYRELIASNLPNVREFFRDDYADLLGPANAWTGERIMEFRKQFINKEVYRALLAAERARFDKITLAVCTPKQRKRVVALMEKNFGPFIDRHA